MRDRTDISGKSFVVVGAASGIGLACARHFIGHGANVYALDVDGASLSGALGDARCYTGTIDVTDETSCNDRLKDIMAQAGQIHGLLNSAGITGETGIRTHEVDVADFDRVFAVNVRGAFLLSKAVVPHMVSHGYGRLVHIASISGKDGNVGMAAYSSSKAATIGLVKVLGKEYCGDGVTVNAIAPAVIRTPMVDAMPEDQVAYMEEKIPMGRAGTLEEIANLAAWMLSEACSFTTGFVFDLSGGRAVY